MAGITANMHKQASEQRKQRIREMVAAGSTRRAVAAIEGVSLKTVDKACAGMGGPTYRKPGEGYQPTSHHERQLARHSGTLAAQRGEADTYCPYDRVKQIALHAAWMAAYWDNRKRIG